jgi:hypothetical protein
MAGARHRSIRAGFALSAFKQKRFWSSRCEALRMRKENTKVICSWGLPLVFPIVKNDYQFENRRGIFAWNQL